MKSSKRCVNVFMRERSSSKPKLMVGRVSAIDVVVVVVAEEEALLWEVVKAFGCDIVRVDVAIVLR